MLTTDQFRALFPRAPASYLQHLNAAMQEAGITTLPRVHAFLAQLGHESAGLRHMQELADGSAYEGRDDLGNTRPGDGRRYKGRGPIQLTGRANYRAAGKALGVDLEAKPEQAATAEVGFRVAGWFWNSRGLNAWADRGDFRAITRRINGGYNGWADRLLWLDKVRRVVKTLQAPYEFIVVVANGVAHKGYLDHEGNALVPIRSVCAELGWGLDVRNGPESQQVQVSRQGRFVTQPLTIIAGVGYVAARELKQIGATVEWDGATRTVVIS